jgi:hypothetical protein
MSKLIKQMKTTGILLLIGAVCSKIIQLSEQLMPHEALHGFPYAIVNFYDSKSEDTIPLFFEAEAHFRSLAIAKDSEVAFAQVNLDEAPILAIAGMTTSRLPV